jgi:hypothetical protein
MSLTPSYTIIMNGRSGVILYLMLHMINHFNNDLLDGTIAITCDFQTHLFEHYLKYYCFKTLAIIY